MEQVIPVLMGGLVAILSQMEVGQAVAVAVTMAVKEELVLIQALEKLWAKVVTLAEVEQYHKM
jgi:hypothetical protein